jgi:hypothetical protein
MRVSHIRIARSTLHVYVSPPISHTSCPHSPLASSTLNYKSYGSYGGINTIVKVLSVWSGPNYMRSASSSKSEEGSHARAHVSCYVWLVIEVMTSYVCVDGEVK